ncbi:scavenger receptor class F member 2-like [Haliotis asinina]|uniref:scavenger receptor class F member 2-like n=1 Tax=Haliotis asinina TaxID=109174 RepID=UPI003532622B
MSTITSLGLVLLVASQAVVSQYTDCQIKNCLICRERICTVCDSGLYGRDCSLPCPANCEKRLVCPHGFCNGGCRDGWYGSRCNTRCPDGCLVCDKHTGRCTKPDAPPTQEVCPANCYCVGATCIQCRTGFTGHNCQHQESPKENKPSSGYDVLTAVLTGVGLLLGVTMLTLCVACYICQSQKRSRRASVGVGDGGDVVPAYAPYTVRQSPVQELRCDNSPNRTLFLPAFSVAALPPSYDSLFCEPSRDTRESQPTCKPPSYEAIHHV